MIANEFLFGVCYYPEHWEKSDIDEDLQRIKQCGMNVVRLGEFSWHSFEPEDSVYDFSFLTKIVKKCAEYGLAVILGTPTAAPPAWLIRKHPEALAVTFDRQVMQHGSRRYTNYTAESFRSYSLRIVERMAECYKDEPNVIGWQIDNEFHCHIHESYADSDFKAFREWLKRKYGSIMQVNKAWGTVFWGQGYNCWEEVNGPLPTPAKMNPSMLLDYKRFLSDMTIEYAGIQSEALRRITPDKFITHNGIFKNLDYAKLTELTLDFLSYDSYPTFGEMEKRGAGRGWNRPLSKVRGVSDKFLVLEQQTGPGGQLTYMTPAPEPGQIRLWTYQSIGNGAVGIVYFRWRTCTVGAEQQWHGILDYDSLPNRRYMEVQQIGEEMKRIGALLKHAKVRNQAAYLLDFDNELNSTVETYLQDIVSEEASALFAVCDTNQFGLDYISDIDRIGDYKVIFYLHPSISSPIVAEKLAAFVSAGGTLVMGARSGYKTEWNHCLRQPLPGVFQALAGVMVEEHTILSKDHEHRIDINGESIIPEKFIEMLSPVAARPIAYYTSRHYQGKPALTVNEIGNGRTIYFGSYFNQASFRKVLDLVRSELPASPFIRIPEEVQISNMTHEGKWYYMLLNYGNSEANLDLGAAYTDLITGEEIKNRLPPYGVAIVEVL
ncbi:beta-galactosidase [Cohnella cholangitidis]|uniref:Beta-galactosidase n=1 Tax=Cohnella cholangitidis TaxID=2598458 RepID=A0A7G5C454_9BACL|nr:beta-galactosidase [Cohnella cholangitidis]QMV43988.1 beta-galactosidase [Cohnella cholangitidis]